LKPADPAAQARAVLAEANAALSSPRGAAAEAAAVLAGLDQTLKDNAIYGSITSPLKVLHTIVHVKNVACRCAFQWSLD